MKKINFAATALFSIAAGSAAAQTNITMYGAADLGLVREMGGAAGSVTKLGSGIQAGSRIGFKGMENLGDGLTALFVMEMGMDMSTGISTQSGVLFGRQTYVGLGSSTMGTLTFGRQYSAVNNAVALIDVFYGGLAGAAFNLMSGGGKGVETGGLGGTLRMNNAIKYAAPTVGGFNGEISYAFGEVAGNAAASRQIDGSIGYTNGPVTVTLAHNRINDATAAAPGKVTFLGGRYDFGVATLALGAAINKGAYSALANILNPDSRDYMIGARVPIGSGAFLISYIKKNDRSAADNDANMAAVGYVYSLSKRTNLYTSYGRMRNTVSSSAGRAGGFYTLGNASDPGTGDKQFDLGMRHTF